MVRPDCRASSCGTGSLFAIFSSSMTSRVSSPCGSTSAPYSVTVQVPFSGLSTRYVSYVGPTMCRTSDAVVVRVITRPDGDRRLITTSLPGHRWRS